MALKRSVEVRSYDAQNQLVFHQVFPNSKWYEELHPIIDSDEERVRLSIKTTEGHQYDSSGDITVRWRLIYSQTGQLAEEWVWRRDGSTEHNKFD